MKKKNNNFVFTIEMILADEHCISDQWKKRYSKCRRMCGAHDILSNNSWLGYMLPTFANLHSLVFSFYRSLLLVALVLTVFPQRSCFALNWRGRTTRQCNLLLVRQCHVWSRSLRYCRAYSRSGSRKLIHIQWCIATDTLSAICVSKVAFTYMSLYKVQPPMKWRTNYRKCHDEFAFYWVRMSFSRVIHLHIFFMLA